MTLRRLAPLLGLLTFVLSSCGTLAYDRAWNRFEDPEDGVALVGRWQGTWKSDQNGHAGRLRGMLTRTGEDEFLARFHSTYGWFFFFRHSTTFRITDVQGGELRFEGEEDLGSMVGGLYRYRGSVVGDHFEATYEAENGDHGTFALERLRPAAGDPPP